MGTIERRVVHVCLAAADVCFPALMALGFAGALGCGLKLMAGF